MSPEGGFFGGKITECSVNPAQREPVGSPSRGRINWRESSLGVLASIYGFFKNVFFLASWHQHFLTFQSVSLISPFSHSYFSVSSLLFDSSV